MPKPKLNEELRISICSTAKIAGDKLLSLWPGGEGAESELVINAKSDGTLVSTADFASNEILMRDLAKLLPEADIFSEEEDQREGFGELVWIIDPLDGTHHFLEGLNDFAVQIALCFQGQIIASCMHYPALETTVSAIKGQGTHIEGLKGGLSMVQDFTAGRSYSRGYESKEHHLINTDKPNSQFGLLQLCLGEYDAVVLNTEPLGEYDVAAAVLSIIELGGRVSDQEGKPLQFAQGQPMPAYLLASNGALHDKLLALFS